MEAAENRASRDVAVLGEGMSRTYKTARTAKGRLSRSKSHKTLHPVGWVVGWKISRSSLRMFLRIYFIWKAGFCPVCASSTQWFSSRTELCLLERPSTS
jgi:hypothetical protein